MPDAADSDRTTVSDLRRSTPDPAASTATRKAPSRTANEAVGPRATTRGRPLNTARSRKRHGVGGRAGERSEICRGSARRTAERCGMARAGRYQASVASCGPRPGGAACRVGGRVARCSCSFPTAVQAEGPEGAWRVSYDDIDLLKVLNMDPVPPNAATMMPAGSKGSRAGGSAFAASCIPPFQQTGIHAFGLARDNQICCFGRNPKIYDVFDVLLRDGVTTDYLPNRPFDVVGVFHIRPEAEDGKLYRLYEMDDATVIVK